MTVLLQGFAPQDFKPDQSGKMVSDKNSAEFAKNPASDLLHRRMQAKKVALNQSIVAMPKRSTEKMKRKTVKIAIATQPRNTGHSFAHKVLDSVATAIRRSHDMQQMLNRYH